MHPKEHYAQFGYVVIRAFWQATELAELDRLVSRIYEPWAERHRTEIFENKWVNMHSLTLPEYFNEAPAARIALFNRIASSKLTQLLDQMFGSGFYFHNTQLFFNPTNPQRLPYWHRDMQYSLWDDETQRKAQGELTSLHVRIPLVAEQSLELVPGSHQRWDTKTEHDVRYECNGHKNSESLKGAKQLNLAAGDLVIFDAQMLHRGVYAGNASRKAFDICLGHYHPLTAKFFDKRVLPTFDELAGIANDDWYLRAYDVVNRRS